jgi:hypothetical protein
MRGRRATNKAISEFWTRVKGDYPFHAKSPTSVKPNIVVGDHVSAVFAVGWRTWGFRTEVERDRFVAQFRAFKVDAHAT